MRNGTVVFINFPSLTVQLESIYFISRGKKKFKILLFLEFLTEKQTNEYLFASQLQDLRSTIVPKL